MVLDFSVLTDDQLIGLIAAACNEAVARGSATEAAARGAMLSAKERADVASAATARETERVRQEEAARVAAEAAAKVRRHAENKAVESVADQERRAWARRKGIAQALADVGWSVAGDSIVAWMSSARERRIFLQQTKFNGATYATLYVTGNAKKAPGTVEMDRGMDATLKAAVPAILRAVARDWTTLKVDLAAALAWEGEAIPLVLETPATAKETAT